MELVPKNEAVKVRKLLIIYENAYRYMQMGILLHIMGALGIIMFLWFGQQTLMAWEEQNIPSLLLCCYLTVYGLTLPFFAELDARSRFQNYKAAKDALYRHGFQSRIIDLFIMSRCQRDAIEIAARDLGFLNELKQYFYQQGYRWYHILPDFLFQTPSMLFTRSYWEKTLFVKRYISRYFLW